MTYFHYNRTSPIVTRLLLRVGRGLALALAAVMLLTLTTPQAQAQAPPWGSSYNPDTYRRAVVPLPFFQIINNASNLGELDVYIDNHRFWNDASFQTAVSFYPIMRGSHKIDFVAGTDADNSNPIWTDTLAFDLRNTYALIPMGLRADSTLDVLVLDNLRLQARRSDRVEYVLVHGAADVSTLDVRILDDVNGNRPLSLVANNLVFGGFRGYGILDPIEYNFQVTNADNSKIFDVLRFELQSFEGETFIFLLTPGAADSTVTLVGFDAFGRQIHPSIVTATDDAPTVPETLALRGNFPNPFNPSTMITFDLAETAEVSVEILDLLGRSVLTMPARSIEAGAARTLTVDASTLASGTYLYRVIAQMPTRAQIQTGRMVLVR